MSCQYTSLSRRGSTGTLSNVSRSSSTSSFHDIKMLELPRLEVDRQFYDVRLLASGWYTKIFVARHRKADDRVVLKCVQKGTTKKEDFFREFHYNYYLSPHPNIIKSFHVPFDTHNSYVFAQELAPEGDLSQFVRRGGLGEKLTKLVAEKVAFALEFVHSKDLVHRDVTPDNILIFDREMARVKLGDFGNTQREGAFVKQANIRVPWVPPEVREVVYNEGYHVHSGQDAWQLGILIFLCLTGSHPWSSADITDRHYNSWVAWLKRKTTKVPLRFTCFTPRLLRLLRRLLEPKPEKRAGVKEVYKYLSDSWLLKGIDPYDISFDDTPSDTLETTSNSMFKDAEKKIAELLRSYYVTQNLADQAKLPKRVRFALEIDAVSDSAAYP
ncbi:LOW QUALITY PROTEIN: serine/threonine-protein kinase SBK1 [Procambarus clarkii]|uniref:LOW QUALITY PROTEIN: serine/threonine-protein kinase SBK1 n=1 Tax=Procambarus clarkii TaxID=6728 RepID=UPI003743C934